MPRFFLPSSGSTCLQCVGSAIAASPLRLGAVCQVARKAALDMGEMTWKAGCVHRAHHVNYWIRASNWYSTLFNLDKFSKVQY